MTSVRITLRWLGREQELPECVVEMCRERDAEPELCDNDDVGARGSSSASRPVNTPEGKVDDAERRGTSRTAGDDAVRVDNWNTVGINKQFVGTFPDGMITGQIGHDGVSRVWRWDAKAGRNVLVESTEGDE